LNDGLFPTNGQFHSFSVEVADKYLGSEVNYARFSATAQFYKPIWGPFIFRLRLDSGNRDLAQPGGGADLRTLLPGRHQHHPRLTASSRWGRRSRPSRSRTRTPSSSLHLRRQLAAVLNSEIEFLIIPAVQIKGVIFFDAGNGYNLEKRYCSSATANANLPDVFNPCQFYPTFQNLRYSVGFRLPLVLAHRTPALRVGHPAQTSRSARLDRVRVHDWQLLLAAMTGRVKLTFACVVGK